MRFRALALASSLVLLHACSESKNPTGERANGPLGSIALALEVAPGVEVDEIVITVVGSFGTITQSLPPSANPSTFIGGLPPGPATVTIQALFQGQVVCEGTASVNIQANQTTTVSVPLQCPSAGDRGDIDINGKFNPCPVIQFGIATPSTAAVGESVSVSVTASDPEGDPLTYAWTATDGTFANPAAPSTSYTCMSPGSKNLTATVSDNRGCDETVGLRVSCGIGTALCGNGVIDPGELCDGPNLNGETCATVTMNAMPGGTLGCSLGCNFDTRNCTGGVGGAGGSGGMGGGGGMMP